MSWIESHQSLANHPKLIEASERLGINRAQMIGHLHLLWWWCVDYALDGNLEKYSPLQIARGADWQGVALAFIGALKDAGFLDEEMGKLSVHDWLDFCGDLIKKRLEYAAEKRGRSGAIKNNSQRKSETSQPTYQPNQPTNQTNQPAPKEGFEILWAKYPRREGKKTAQRYYGASVKTVQDWLDIQNALENYLSQLRINRTEIRFTKQGSTWFNNWRDYVNYKVIESSVIRPESSPPRPKPVEKELSDQEQKEMLEVIRRAKEAVKSAAKDIPKVHAGVHR